VWAGQPRLFAARSGRGGRLSDGTDWYAGYPQHFSAKLTRSHSAVSSVPRASALDPETRSANQSTRSEVELDRC
jgi:hypothetical protein